MSVRPSADAMNTQPAGIRPSRGLISRPGSIVRIVGLVVLSFLVEIALASCSPMPLRGDVIPAGFTFNYAVTNRQDAELIQVFDDGAKTYLQFKTADVHDLRILDETGNALQFDRFGPYAVVASRHTYLIVTTVTGEAQIQRIGAPSPRMAARPERTDAAKPPLEQQAEIIVALRQRIAGLETQLAGVRAQLTAYSSPVVIHFANNSARLVMDPAKVKAIVGTVRDRALILITGYTDANHPDAKGERLACRRAQAVRRAILEQGVAAENVRLQYYAAGHFAVANRTSEGKAMNRRVEIVAEAAAAQSPG